MTVGAAQAMSPGEFLQSIDSTELLTLALQRLPLRRRAVVVMHDLDGCSIVEVARALSLSRLGTYVRLHRGRKELGSALRQLLGRRVRS